MPTFDVTINGKSYEVDAPDPQAAAFAASEAAKQLGSVKPSVAKDVGRSGLGGLINGLAQLPSMGADVNQWTIDKFIPEGRARDVASTVRRALPVSLGGGMTSGEIKGALPGPVREAAAYRPQTLAGEYARTIGENVPNALAPGGLARRAANVLVPAVMSETAGQGARAMGAGEGGEQLARAAGGIAGGALSSLRRPQTRIDEPAAVREAEEALTQAGVNIRHVSQASMGQIRDLIRQGRSPREAALSVVSTTDLPVPVPMTRGQRTGQPGQQLSENLMLRGAKGSGASNQMRGLVSAQQEALRGNVAAIADRVAGGAAPTRGAGGQAVSERLNAMRDAADTGVDRAYSAARASGDGARLPREHAPQLTATLRDGVRDYDMQGVPRVASVLSRIDDLAGSGSVTVRDLFDARSRLSKLQVSTDTVEAGAAKAAVRTFDRYVNSAITDGLLSGDKEAAGLWRSAIARRREFGRLFESGDLIDALTERVARGGTQRALRVDPNDAANYILGRSDMGFVGKQNLYRDMTRLRETLGPQSNEWNALRSEVFQRIGSQGEGAVEFGQRQFSGVKFQKAWQDFNRKDPRLASELFTAEERALVDRFAAIAARVTSPVKGGDNPSNTAVAGARMLAGLKGLRGLPFIKGLADEFEAQVNLQSARSATSQTVSRTALPRQSPIIGRNALIVGGAAGVSGAAPRERRRP